MPLPLIEGRHYETDKGEIVRFEWTGQDGHKIFSPWNERNFQDVFYFKDGWDKHIVRMLDEEESKQYEW